MAILAAALWLGLRNGDVPTKKPAPMPPEPPIDAASLLGLSPRVPQDSAALRQETTATCEALVRDLKQRPEAHALLALMRYRYGLKEESRQAWQDALRLNDKFSPAYLGLGLVAADMGQDADAVASLRRALALNPSLEEAYSKLVEVLLRLNQADEALAVGEEFVRRFPRNSKASFWLGQTFLQLERYQDAIAAHEAVIRQYSDLSVAYYSLAMAHARLGHREQADQARKKFAELKEKDLQRDRNANRTYHDQAYQRKVLAETHLSAGDVYRNAGNPRIAEAHWLRGIQVRSDDLPCREALVTLYQSQQRWLAAADLARQLVSLDPANPDRWRQLGDLRRRTGEPDEAEAAYRRAIALDPDSVPTCLGLLQLALEADRPIADGLSLARKAVELKPTPETYVMLSTLLEQSGDRQGARAAIADAIKLAPHDAQLQQAYELLSKSR
ncbi:MAG: tetratricopeptide repeat protein [Thermoguttaceae bacterium]